MTELIITEKPKSALKVAEALADKKPKKESVRGVSYYKLTCKGKDIIVGCAVGHLFGLGEKEKNKWKYPIFDVEWKPIYEVNKNAKFAKKYIDALKKLSKNVDTYTLATDFDTEGSTLGLNIIRFICKQRDARRMKFSTLTKPDLIKAYENASPHIDWGQAKAGETRHELDWYYGINLSRALTSAIKSAGMFKILSSGRVQGPALKIIVDREKGILSFKPKLYWQIELRGEVKKGVITAWHEKYKLWDKKEAQSIVSKVKGKDGFVKSVEKTRDEQIPPYPFDLTTLQTEAYRCFGVTPKHTLDVAQELYTSGLISYPRTSSQKLPRILGYENIIKNISKQKEYSFLCKNLLVKKMLKPREGKNTDPAHPAIFPTGFSPKGLDKKGKNVYDLIVKRFLACFAESAVKENVVIKICVGDEIFVAKGESTLEKGWYTFYEPYIKPKDIELPQTQENERVIVKKVELYEKQTQPPKRFTQASIIRELEKRNLGTKCLTSNTLVKINSNNQIHNIKIAKLFDGLYNDFPIKDNKSVKIAINNKKTCFSFNEFNEIKSDFKLVSKRKLNKNEKVYRIEYRDGSHIELTEEHPVLIFDNGSCKYIPTKSLKQGMKMVASVKFPEKQGDIICTWEAFLKKCNPNTKLFGISNEIQSRRNKQKVSQKNFGKKCSISQPAISIYESSKSIPLYIIKRLNLSKPKNISSVNKKVIIKNPSPLRMSSSLARILANLIGDGSIDSKKIARENCYDFRYHNTNIDLINKFIKDVKNVFGVNLTIKIAKSKQRHLSKYYVKVPAVIGRIISILFPEVIKKNAVKISLEFYPEFIGSLFDDEGHCMKSDPKLFISNTNFKLLDDVKQMLLTSGIKASLDKKQFKLYIRGRENVQRFLEKIPFASIEKKQRLIDNLTERYSWKSYPILKKDRDILALLNLEKDKELTLKEIAEKIKLPIPNVKDAVRMLRKKGFIKKIIRGISEYPRKRITYKLIKPIENTFYIYLGEEVISSDFITKTIKSVRETDYNGFVYDITNNPEVPNFILGNGVVVHNSTRAQIIETLFKRGYVGGKAIEATGLGFATVKALEKYSPKILDEELTRHFEEEMELVRENKKQPKDVLKEARDVLKKILAEFKEREEKIGQGLLEATVKIREKEELVGKCPICVNGDLKIRRGRYGRFIACSKYPECKTTFSIPSTGLVKTSEEKCKECAHPLILMIRRGKKPQSVCINPECPSKKVEEKIEKRRCPKCKKGYLVLRKSVYGSFLACDKYPKCRYTENINNKIINKIKKIK